MKMKRHNWFRQVWELREDGWSYDAIAAYMGLSPKTVRTYRYFWPIVRDNRLNSGLSIDY